jgi:hypothetical protein
MDVGVQGTVMLRLSNPGNGPDVFDITWSVVPNANFSGDPGLLLSIPSTQYALTAGEFLSIPVSLTLPEEMAASVALELEFEMRSQGDFTVFNSTSLLIEARQDHKWDLLLDYNGVNLTSGSTINADPGESLNVQMIVKNTGNLMDQIQLSPAINIQASGLDEGLGWSASTGESGDVLVNETTSISLVINVSETAWENTMATISFNGLSDDTSIPPFVIHIQTNHKPGWWILAGGADLDIDRNGANITLVVQQKGNAPANPFISAWVDMAGWTINVSGNIPTLNPGESTNFTCEIIPPPGAISGHTVELTLRAKNADGSGTGQTSLPIRVAAWYNYSLEYESQWLVSPTGGLPLAMLSNHGNAPTTIDVEVLGMPSGWILDGPEKLSLGVGESSGIPLSAIPDSNSGGYGTIVTLRTTNEIGTSREITLTLSESARAWETSPVLFGTAGDSLELKFNPGYETNSVQYSGATLPQTDDGGSLWTVPAMDQNGTITVDGILLEFWARTRNPPSRLGSCSVNPINSEPLATCSILIGNEALRWTAILRDETGVVIDHESGYLEENTSFDAINLSGIEWNPSPGEHVLTATLFDGHGGQIAQNKRTVTVKDTAWNLAINAVELRTDSTSQSIVVSISRTNQSKLTDAVCELHFSTKSSSWTAIHRVDVGSDLAPQVVINRPPLDDGATLDVELICQSPWDIDQSPEDNTGLVILADEITASENSLDYLALMGGIVVVFGAMGLLGMIRPESQKRNVKSKTKQKKSRTHSSSPKREIHIDEDDDIFFDDEQEIDEILEEEILDSESHEEEGGDEIEIVKEKTPPLDEFEARLERLRERRDRLGGI